jgi:hypothetical protein
VPFMNRTTSLPVISRLISSTAGLSVIVFLL